MRFINYRMKIHKGITIRIKPNAQQRSLLENHFNQTRFVWNYFLEKRKREYIENKQSSNYFRDCAELTKLKQEKEWLYESSSGSQQRALKFLDDSFKRFYKRLAKFPNFKKKGNNASFAQAGLIKISNKRIIFPKFQEGIRFNRTLPAFDKINNINTERIAFKVVHVGVGDIREGDAKIAMAKEGTIIVGFSVTIDKYYAVLSVECEVEALPKTGKQCGIDLGVTDFCVVSNGKRIKNPKHTKKYEKSLATAQRHLARKVKGSKRRDKQRRKVAAIHGKIANCRKDHLHNASAFLVKNFDLVCMESLSIKNMTKLRSLSKAISDCGWGDFTRQLEYKTAACGRELVKVGRFFPSSRTCHGCGHIAGKLKLSQREWNCSACGATLGRDHNASLNILKEGLRELSERQSPNTGMEPV